MEDSERVKEIKDQYKRIRQRKEGVLNLLKLISSKIVEYTYYIKYVPRNKYETNSNTTKCNNIINSIEEYSRQLYEVWNEILDTDYFQPNNKESYLNNLKTTININDLDYIQKYNDYAKILIQTRGSILIISKIKNTHSLLMNAEQFMVDLYTINVKDLIKLTYLIPMTRTNEESYIMLMLDYIETVNYLRETIKEPEEYLKENDNNYHIDKRYLPIIHAKWVKYLRDFEIIRRYYNVYEEPIIINKHREREHYLMFEQKKK